MVYYGGIEAGGTKFICAVGSSPDQILAETRFPTTTPEETLARTVDFFRHTIEKNNIHLEGIGIGGFGPLDLNPKSADFGKITATPKPGWQFVDIFHTIQDQTGVQSVLETDVNAAALGEGRWGAAQGYQNYVVHHHWHRYRRRIGRGWKTLSRPGPPGDGARPPCS